MTQPNEQLTCRDGQWYYRGNEIFTDEAISFLLEENKRLRELEKDTRRHLGEHIAGLEFELEQTKEELECERETRQSDIDEAQLQSLAEIGRLSRELEQVKAERDEQVNATVSAKHALRQIIGDLTPAEFVVEVVQNQEEFKRVMDENQSLHTELAAKDKVLQWFDSDDTWTHPWSKLMRQGRKIVQDVLSSYPPREKGATE